MKPAAKKKNSPAMCVIASMIVWASALLLSSSASASSASPVGLKSSAEVSDRFSSKSVESLDAKSINATRYYDRLGEVALECIVAPVRTAADDLVIDAYGNLSRRADIPGQAHHLNQDAAFRSHIAHADGVSVKLEGNAFRDVGSPHYNAHESMESFWDIYRRGGLDAGNLPTNSQYNRALYNGLQESGLSPAEALRAVQAAKRQQLDAGLRGSDLVPRIPGRIGQARRGN